MSAKKALGAKTGKAAKQFVKKSAPSTYLQTFIRAGQAAAAPPLGPSLGSPDRSVTIKHNKPPVTYFLKKAAGARKGALYAHSVGIQVVSHLDSKEYQEFLRERELRIEEHEAKLEEIRQSKLLHTDPTCQFSADLDTSRPTPASCDHLENQNKSFF
ncbi:hypothetical protein MAR_000287 [Mya arenaria]|uniref:Uncharacterized protein n=1 Tax=Mya arenaria TaxID=6604 RepID=A0ABY7FAR4_MYAAR|nr:hypothetical protein MAR_000287 [Mya arenaria]